MSDDPRLNHWAALLHIADLNRQLAEANAELDTLRALEGTVKRLIEEMIS